MSNKPTCAETVAKVKAIKVFENTSLAKYYGEEGFWRCKKALQAFLNCCRKACGKQRRLTPEQEKLMEEVKNALAVLKRQEKAAA